MEVTTTSEANAQTTLRMVARGGSTSEHPTALRTVQSHAHSPRLRCVSRVPTPRRIKSTVSHISAPTTRGEPATRVTHARVQLARRASVLTQDPLMQSPLGELPRHHLRFRNEEAPLEMPEGVCEIHYEPLPPSPLPKRMCFTLREKRSFGVRAASSSGPPSTGTRTTQKIPTMQDMFMRHLTENAPKRGMVRDLVGSLTYREMTEDLEKFIALQLEGSTWKGYSRAWSGLEEFCARVQLPTCEFAAALYIRRLMLTASPKTGRYLLVSTLYGYSKAISAVTGRLDPTVWRQGYLAIVNRILVKMGARIPTQQAQPITRSQVYEFVTRNGVPEEYRMLVYLAWKLAARADDLLKCFTNDCQWVTHKGKELLVVRWRPSERIGVGSGRQKNSTNGLGHSCVLDCGDFQPRVRRYIKSRKGLSLSSHTAAQVSTYLKKYIDQRLSAHSPKRGALQELLRLEARMPLIIAMARHAGPHDVPAATKTYLDAIPLALAVGTQEGTAML